MLVIWLSNILMHVSKVIAWLVYALLLYQHAWAILELICHNYLKMKVVIINSGDLHDDCKLIKRTQLWDYLKLNSWQLKIMQLLKDITLDFVLTLSSIVEVEHETRVIGVHIYNRTIHNKDSTNKPLRVWYELDEKEMKK